MRLATMLFALLLSGASLLAQDPPPPPGEEKPKTEEEILWEGVWAALDPLKTFVEQEIEKQEAILKKAEDDLFALGAKAIPHLETLLPVPDAKGFYAYPAKLKEFFGREEQEAPRVIEAAMRRGKWVSESDKAKLKGAIEELKDKESKPEDLFSLFSELRWYGIEGLRQEYSAAADAAMKTKILAVLDKIARQGSKECIDFLLDLTLLKDSDARRQAMQSLVNLAQSASDRFEEVDKTFIEDGAYQMMVGFLRLDEDVEMRALAARFLRWMEVREAANELVNALDDPKDRVVDEALNAITRIAGDGIKDSGKMKFDILMKAARAWWKKTAPTYPAQIKPAPPARKKAEDGKK